MSANSLSIDGGSAEFAYISSASTSAIDGLVGSGNAGTVHVTVAGSLTLKNGGYITTSATDAQGSAGDVSVVASTLTLDGGTRGLSRTAISSATDTLGNAGNVTIAVGGEMQVLNGGTISVSTLGKGNAGDLTISAGNLVMDGGVANKEGFNYIASDTFAAGNGGKVGVTVTGLLTLDNGASIAANTYGSGTAGDVTVSAKDVIVDGGAARAASISSLSGANPSGLVGSGDAGAVSVTAKDSVTLQNGGFISTSASGAKGAAGNVTISAGSLTLDGGVDGADITRIFSVTGTPENAGNVSITVTGEMQVLNGATISVSTSSKGNAGDVTVSAGSLFMDGGVANTEGFDYIASETKGAGNGGTVSVTVPGPISVLNGASIEANTYGSGTAGDVTVSAKDVIVDGGAARAASISSLSGASPSGLVGSGDAGVVSVTAKDSVTLQNGGFISTSASGAKGAAGNVTISAGSLTLDGGVDGADITRIFSVTGTPENAGNVSITVTGEMQALNGATISVSTLGKGNAGDVTVSAGSLFMDGGVANKEGFNYIASDTFASGNGGKVDVTVKTGQLTLDNGASIAANTYGSGTAGDVTVSAKDVTIDGGAAREASISSASLTSPNGLVGSGNAGVVAVTATDGMTLQNGGFISTSAADATGAAGNVTITAGSLKLDGVADVKDETRIFSVTGTPENAGNVSITVTGEMQVLNGATISASTSGKGEAGDVTVSAGSLFMDGGVANKEGVNYIASETVGSGNGGTVSVAVTGLISILNGSEIAANSYGKGSAGDVSVTAGSLVLDGAAARFASIASSSTTSLFSGLVGLGNAGTVTVNVTGSLLIENGALISTSAFDKTGAAGDLDVTSHNLVLQSGALIETNSGNANPAGNVIVTAPQIEIDGVGSEITSANLGPNGGPAGSITINTDPITLSDGGAITTDSTSGAAGSITLNFAQGGLLTLEGTSAVGEITTSSFTKTAGQITVSGASAIIMNGGKIQARGPFSGAFVTIDAGTVVESSDRPNTIVVDGKLVFDSTFEQISNAVTLSDLSFVDASKVLKGECPALAASGGTSALVTTPTGPYAMDAAERATDRAAAEPRDRTCEMAPAPR